MQTVIAIYLFDAIAFIKGYRFVKVRTKQQYEDMDKVYNEEGFSFPEHLQADIQKYKAGALNFIAYHKGIPAGTIRLASPKIVNRAYDHYGVDKEGKHHEIQSLVVSKDFRDGAQFVMLGLVKKIYTYSIANSIPTWSACGKRSLYLTMRKYCKKMEVIDVDFKKINHPVTQFLYANNIVETYFIMEVSGFKPDEILKKLVKKLLKKSPALHLINGKIF